MATADDLRAKLKELGLEFLFATLEKKIGDTTISIDPDTIGRIIETDPDTAKQYKERFSGNDFRIAAGLRALKPSEYIAAEKSYISTLRNTGMPVGFYDTPADLAKFVGADLSTVELEGRIVSGYRAASQADPATKQQLFALYGIDEKDLAAYYLDPQKATDALNRKKDAALFGRQIAAAGTAGQAATQAGITLGAGQAEELASQGIVGQAAKTAFTTIAEEQQLYSPLQGEQAITQAEQIGAATGTSAAAAQRVAQRRRARQAEFAAGGGFAATQAGATGLKTVGD